METEANAPAYFENVVLSLWRACEGSLEFQYRLLQTVFQVDFFGHSARHDLMLSEGSEASQIVHSADRPFLRYLGPPLCKVLPPAGIAALLLAREIDDAPFVDSLAEVFFLDPKTKELVNPRAADILVEMGYSKALDVLKKWWTRIPKGDRFRLEVFAAADSSLSPHFLRALPSEIIDLITSLDSLPQEVADYSSWFPKLPLLTKLAWTEKSLDFWPIVLGTTIKKYKLKIGTDIIADMKAPVVSQFFLSAAKATSFDRRILSTMLELFSDDSSRSSDTFFNSFLIALNDSDMELYFNSCPTLERLSQELWVVLDGAARQWALLVELHQEFPFSHDFMSLLLASPPENVTACLARLARSKLMPSPTQTADALYLALTAAQQPRFLTFILHHERHVCDPITPAFAASVTGRGSLAEAIGNAADPRQVRWGFIYETIIRNRPLVSLAEGEIAQTKG